MMCVRMYVSVMLRNVAVTSRWTVPVGARSRSALPRGSRTAPGRAKGLEENGAGPSGGGGGERGIHGIHVYALIFIIYPYQTYNAHR